LGLGFFIAKTLLERSGARIRFHNRIGGEKSGAVIHISWPRAAIEAKT
jgi:two-component system sensor histidine kinase RegB